MDSYCDRQDCLAPGNEIQKLKGFGYIKTCEKHSHWPEDFLLPGVFFIWPMDRIDQNIGNPQS